MCIKKTKYVQSINILSVKPVCDYHSKISYFHILALYQVVRLEEDSKGLALPNLHEDEGDLYLDLNE